MDDPRRFARAVVRVAVAVVGLAYLITATATAALAVLMLLAEEPGWLWDFGALWIPQVVMAIALPFGIGFLMRRFAGQIAEVVVDRDLPVAALGVVALIGVIAGGYSFSRSGWLVWSGSYGDVPFRLGSEQFQFFPCLIVLAVIAVRASNARRELVTIESEARS